MVTLPSEAATDYEMVREIVKRGANCVRINCAHDNPESWDLTSQNVRRAEIETNSSCKVMMDLGGPKIRTGSVIAPEDRKRAFKGDFIVLLRQDAEEVISSPTDKFYTSCTVPEILDLLEVDTPVYIDDGKIRTRIVDCQYSVAENLSGILLEVTNVSPKEVKLRPEKGINFPKTVLFLSPLTEKDLQDLDKVRAILSLSTTFNRESKYATVDAKKAGKKAEIIKAIAYLNNMRSLQLQTRSGNNRGLIHSC